MQATITKQQFRDLNEHRGHVDTDSGQVFVRFIGASQGEGPDLRFVGELVFQPSTDDASPSFSVAAILKPPPDRPASKAKPKPTAGGTDD